MRIRRGYRFVDDVDTYTTVFFVDVDPTYVRAWAQFFSMWRGSDVDLVFADVEKVEVYIFSYLILHTEINIYLHI